MEKRLTPDKLRVGDKINGHEKGWLTVLSIDRGGSIYEPVIYVEVETAKGIKTLDCVKHPWGWSDEFEVVRLRESATNNIKYKKAGNNMIKKFRECKNYDGVSGRRRLTESNLSSEIVLIVKSKAYVDITEDDYEQGALDTVNSWDFDVRGTYRNAKELVSAIAKESFVFSEDVNDYYILDGALHTSAMVDNDNYVPDEEQVDAWKRGEEKLYIADMYLSIEVGCASHDITDDEAEMFGFNLG